MYVGQQLLPRRFPTTGEAVVWTLARYTRGQRFYEATGWQLDGGIRDDGRQVRYRQRLAP